MLIYNVCQVVKPQKACINRLLVGFHVSRLVSTLYPTPFKPILKHGLTTLAKIGLESVTSTLSAAA